MAAAKVYAGAPPSITTLTNMPNEIQQMIFAHVLRAEHSLVKTLLRARRTRGGSDVNMALFTVSKQVSANTRVAFFDENVIGITKSENEVYLPEMRSVELTGDYAAQICNDEFLDVSKIAKFLKLPRLQALHIAVGTLAEYRQTVRSFVGQIGRSSSLRCVGIGLFELKLGKERMAKLRGVHTTAAPIIYLRNLKLEAILPEARIFPTTYDITCLNKAVDSFIQGHLTYNADAIVYDFAIWLCSYQSLRALRDSPGAHGLTAAEVRDAEELEEEGLIETDDVSSKSSLLPEKVRIFDLTARKHSPALLEWASELMGLNLHALIADHIEIGTYVGNVG